MKRLELAGWELVSLPPLNVVSSSQRTTLLGTWRWSDGFEWKFTNWNKGEPNDGGGGEDCVSLNSKDQKWNDISCTKSLPFICEREPIEKQRTIYKLNRRN